MCDKLKMWESEHVKQFSNYIINRIIIIYIEYLFLLVINMHFLDYISSLFLFVNLLFLKEICFLEIDKYDLKDRLHSIFCIHKKACNKLIYS